MTAYSSNHLLDEWVGLFSSFDLRDLGLSL